MNSSAKYIPQHNSAFNGMRKWAASVLFVLVFGSLNAQHYQFSQFYSARTYLNPAFTGVNACSKLSINYRDQWPSVPGAFITYQASFEHVMLNSGVGLLFFSDKTGFGGLSSTMFSGLYAYEVGISRKKRLRFGIQAGGVSRKIDYQSLLFGDQIARGSSVPTVENPTHSSAYLDFAAGALYYTRRMWLGVSASHLSQPDQSLIVGQFSNLPFELKVHGGRKLFSPRDKGSWDVKYYTVAFNYKMQEEFDQVDIGLYYTRQPLNIGLWYRGIPLLKAYKPGYSNNDAVAILIGLTWDRFTTGYSYDLTISKLTYLSGGAHELSISYNFCDNKRKKLKTVLVSCPKF